LFAATPIAIIEWNPSFSEVTAWNPAAENIFGFTAAEMVHTNALNLVPKYELERVADQISNTLVERCSWTCVNENVRKDGTTILCEWTNTPILTEDGEILCIYSLVQDVTGRIVSQKKLEESEQRLRDVSEAVGKYIWEIDGQGRYTFITERCRAIKGFAAAELLGKTPFEFMPPEDIVSVQEILKVACDRKASFHLTHRNVTPTGEILWEEVYGLPLLDSMGEIVGFRGTGLSITERKRSEEALKQSEARFHAIAASIPGVILRYMLTAEGSQALQYVSPRCAEVYGVSPEEALEDPNALFRRTHPEDLPKVQTAILESARSLNLWSSEFRLVLPSGEEKWILGCGMPELQPNGDVVWNTMLLEITAQKEAELALRQSEERFQSIANNMPGLILRYILRTDYTDGFLYLSPRCWDIFECSPEEALLSPQKIWNCFSAEDIPQMQASILESARTLDTWVARAPIVTPGGKQKWIEAKGTPARQSNGDVIWDTILMDITAQQAAEEALRLQQQALRQHNEAIAHLMRSNLTECDITEAAHRLTELVTERLQLDRASLWLAPLERPDQLICEDAYSPATHTHTRGECLFQEQFPHYFAALQTERVLAAPDVTQDPRLTELLAAYFHPHDVRALLDVPIIFRGVWVGVICCEQVRTPRDWRLEEENFVIAIADFLCLLLESADRRRVEREVQKALSEALGLNAILDNLVDGLLVVDLQAFVTQCNPALREIYDLPPNLSIVGSYCFDLPLAELQDLIRSASEQPTEIFSGDVALPKGRIGQAIATGVFSSGGRTTQNWLGIAVLIRDITNEREVDKMKTDFISTVSHELRTPLTSVLGFASIIKEKLTDEIFPIVEGLEQKKLSRSLKKVDSNLNIIVSEAERLTSLINDVLDIAKMEAGKIEWRMEQIGINIVIERAFNATASLFQQSGLEAAINIAPDLPPIIGDRDRLIQVLINLISNAVKFTEQGSVTCTARRQGDELLVQVVDTGIGIAPEDCGKVFEKFKQVGDTLTDKPKGTGLGLAICMQIIEHHGGRIWVESAIGAGSTFQFTLPLTVEHRPIAQPRFDALIHQLQRQIVAPNGSGTGQKRILIVDDDAHIRELLRQELEQAGYTVLEAWDGFAAIQQVKSLKPDLVVMDVMMPQMNGFDAAAVLRNDPDIADIPIIMLSIVQDKERGYRLGIDRYLTKPIDRDRLLGDIESLLHQGGSTKKVLIVDRNASTATTLAEVLQAKGYVVSAAQSEREGLEQAIRIKPDVIIVDALLGQESELVTALRFERDFHDVVFMLMPEGDGLPAAPV
jgi:PAS domain S-box-containing protein